MENMKRVCLLVVLIIASLTCAFTGGSGSLGDPYQISTQADLEAVAGSPSAYYILINDIDLDGVTYTGSVIATFTGSFNGNGFVVKNLTINGGTNDYIGLFGSLDVGASIASLGIEGCNVSGNGYVGGLAGQVNTVTITNCYSTGAVSGLGGVGGLVGYSYIGTFTSCFSTAVLTGSDGDTGGLVGSGSYGSISNSHADGAVNCPGTNVGGLMGLNYYVVVTNSYAAGVVTSAGICVGGLIGQSYSGELTTCWAMGSVIADSYAGGLVGYNTGSITACSATGSVTGSGYRIGGLVGTSYAAAIVNCYAVGDVSGQDMCIGGLVGEVGSGIITNCYALGNVSGQSYTGGLLGNNGGEISNCYARGDVSGTGNVGGFIGGNGSAGLVNFCYSTGAVSGTDWGVGGFIGFNDMGTVSNCFWDVETSGQSISEGGTGNTTAVMMSIDTFMAAGWDYTSIWKQIKNSYPIFLTQTFPSDFNRDYFIDYDDLMIFADEWLVTGSGMTADINQDGAVDILDYAIFASQWVGGQREPEPELSWIFVTEPDFGGQMSKYETTNAQYCQFLNAALASGDILVEGNYVMGANGSNRGEDFVASSYYRLDGMGYTYDGAIDGGAARIYYSENSFSVEPGFEEHPVTFVTWYGATAFCSYYGWRLPTESEWQDVADYDGSYTFGCGTTIDNNKANCLGSTHPYGTTAVGAFGTYGYGMADMSGNVFEWTSTDYYGSRVIRGGAWFTGSGLCTVSYMSSHFPDSSSVRIGFRVCR